jgi:hypothetical protein
VQTLGSLHTARESALYEWPADIITGEDYITVAVLNLAVCEPAQLA